MSNPRRQRARTLARQRERLIRNGCPTCRARAVQVDDGWFMPHAEGCPDVTLGTGGTPAIQTTTTAARAAGLPQLDQPTEADDLNALIHQVADRMGSHMDQIIRAHEEKTR